MIVIGVTGSLGTGKSSVASAFAKLGAQVLDADVIAHDLMRPGKVCHREIIRRFGMRVLENGCIDRKKLAALVFNNVRQRKALERMVHPRVINAIRSNISRCRREPGIKAVVMDVPLLFESGLDKLADVTVTVRARQRIQLERIKNKGGISRNEALRRIRAQMPLSQKSRLSDFTIDNNGSLTETRKQVLNIWNKLLHCKKIKRLRNDKRN